MLHAGFPVRLPFFIPGPFPSNVVFLVTSVSPAFLEHLTNDVVTLTIPQLIFLLYRVYSTDILGYGPRLLVCTVQMPNRNANKSLVDNIFIFCSGTLPLFDACYIRNHDAGQFDATSSTRTNFMFDCCFALFLLRYEVTTSK